MKIRFISDIHYFLNSEYETAELLNIFSKKEPADVTLIAGDASADIEEMDKFLNTYFKDEKVVFINGNHCLYNKTGKFYLEQIKEYKERFNGQWKFLENDYEWLNEDIAVIGCIGWTDYKYHSYKSYHNMYDEQGRRLDQNGNILPIDPRDTPEFKEKVKEILNKKEDYSILDKELKELYRSVSPDVNERVDTSFKNRVSPEVYQAYIDWQENLSKQGKYEFSQEDYTRYNKRIARQCMNDFNYGKVPDSDPLFGGFRYMNPDDCEKWHKESKKYIKKAYNEIIAKNPNATIILMTHHPFTKKCEHKIYVGKELNAAFISDCDKWLKQFKNIKYYHCGHVHNRFFDKIGHIDLICNPMGYLFHGEQNYEIPFNINFFLEVYCNNFQKVL